MSSIAATRVQRELRDIQSEWNNQHIRVELRNDEFTNLKGEIKGPPGTPYEGGTFKLAIRIPETYPFNPPKVNFETRVWHPNISSVTGAICLDILKDQWAAALTLRTVLLSLQALLSAAEPDDPQDAVVARQFKENRKIFNKTAKFWTHYFANGPGEPDRDCVEKLRKASEMGFYKEVSLQALSTHSWNLESAIQDLTSG